jgi:hypothetical protein
MVRLKEQFQSQSCDIIYAHMHRASLYTYAYLHAHLLELAALDESGSRSLHSEKRNTLGTGSGIGLSTDDHEVSMPSIGDESLAAIDNVVISVGNGGGSHALKIRSST